MDQRNIVTGQSNTLRRIIISLLIFVSVVSPVMARSSTEIGQDIINKQQEILENERRLAEAAANKQYYEAESANLADGVPKLEAQIKQLEEELNGIKLEISILEQQQKLKELEREQTQFSQNETIKGSYMDWKSTSHDVRMFIDEDIDFIKIQQYQSAIAGNQKESILNLTNELVKIDGAMTVLAQKKADLDTKQAEVTEQKRQLEERLAQLRWGISYEAGNISSLNNAVDSARLDVAMLSSEQYAAIIREQEIFQNNPGITNSAGCDGVGVGVGLFYFCGNGRDYVQGHGVGMSQFGAQGAALQGVEAKTILEFYYPGAYLTTVTEPATIWIKYCQGLPTLATYLSNNNCMYDNTYNDGVYNPTYWGPVITQQVSMVDYLAGLGEMPYSWHVEARKAQIIAARTYALRRSNYGDPNYPICLTAHCQVSYIANGQSHERDLVLATPGQVMKYGDNLIDALYSADNSQGQGTANCSTRFQNIDGSPSAGCYPYLVAVNDEGWSWNSRGYWPSYCGSATPSWLCLWNT